MNVQLYKNYYLKSEPLNYILYQKRTVEDSKSKNHGSEYDVVIGYYTTIEGALNSMCNKEIKSCKCTTITGLVREVNKLQDIIAGLCKKIGAESVVKDVLDMYKDNDPILQVGSEDEPEEIEEEEEKPKKKRGRPRKKK